jgi:hypothetical protein
LATIGIYSYSQPDEFTPSHHLSSSTDWNSDVTQYSSASGGSLSSHYFSASDDESVSSYHSVPEGLTPSLTPDASPSSDDAESFKKNMMKKIKIVAGVIIIGGAIISIVWPHFKQDS